MRIFVLRQESEHFYAMITCYKEEFNTERGFFLHMVGEVGPHNNAGTLFQNRVHCLTEGEEEEFAIHEMFRGLFRIMNGNEGIQQVIDLVPPLVRASVRARNPVRIENDFVWATNTGVWTDNGVGGYEPLTMDQMREATHTLGSTASEIRIDEAARLDYYNEAITHLIESQLGHPVEVPQEQLDNIPTRESSNGWITTYTDVVDR